MKFFSSWVTLWKNPRIVVLDLRPLQTSYANRGIGRVTREIATRLAVLLENGGHKRPQTKIYSLTFKALENPIPQIPILITAPSWKRPWLWDQFILPIQILWHRVDTFQNFVALGPLPEISFPILLQNRGIPIVYDWHLFEATATPLEKFYRKTMRIRIQKWGIQKVKRLVVNSDYVKSNAASLKVNLKNIHVIPLGCDHLDLVESESWSMENFVLSIGDTANKNLEFTYKVLLHLRGRFVHLNWVIVGKRERILTHIGLAEGKLPEWISILESPSDGLIKACLQKALVLLFPSIKEGFGIPLLEAMRLGCPVLTTNLDPMKTIVEHSQCLLPPEEVEAWSEAVSRLLFQPEIRQQVQEAGYTRAKEFTWDLAVEKLSKLY